MFEQMLAKLEESHKATLPPTISSVAVIGADPVGQSLACAALKAGCDVVLYSSFGQETRGLTDANDIVVEGGDLTGTFGVVAGDESSRNPSIRVIPEIDLAVRDAGAIFLAVPAYTHASYAALLAPVLRPHQIVVLAPGGSLGAVEVARVLRSQRSRDDVTVVELCSAPYLVSRPQPGKLVVEETHRLVLAAALTNVATQGVTEVLRHILPMLRPASGVLHTTFSNMAGLLVAAPALLSASSPGNASLRERLPADLVDTLLARLDQERRRTAFAFGIRELPTFAEWLEINFGTVEKDAVKALDEVSAYGRIPCPSVGDPAVRDAVATGLVPLVSAGEAAGVATPTTSALVALASALHGFDHLRHGRTMASLGLDRMRPDEVRRALDGTDSAFAQEVLA